MRLSSAVMLVSAVILASPAAGQEWMGRARVADPVSPGNSPQNPSGTAE